MNYFYQVLLLTAQKADWQTDITEQDARTKIFDLINKQYIKKKISKYS